MVKVREDYPMTAAGEVDIPVWVDQICEHVVANEPQRLIAACELSRQVKRETVAAGQVWSERACSFLTGLEMAQILAELSLDEDTLIAAVLYRAVREQRLSLASVGEQFGPVVHKLIEGVLQMAAITALQHPIRGNVLGQSEGQVHNVRRMLVSLIDDVRIALIKLSERTCAIRAVKDASAEKRHRVAREVFDIYAPLAHRLGIGYIKWELEDLSFRYLHESAYKKIAKLLDEKRVARQDYIDNALERLKDALQQAGIEAELSGRAKHIYSIWRKMHRKNIDFSQVYDIRALRVLVPEVRDCYASLGIVHSLWPHVPNEFDDYIASPKENGYRSLHTAVVGPEGKVMEVQIRTHEMHEEAEFGVCAHWLYKGAEPDGSRDAYDEKITWLRQVLEWHEELGDEALTQLKADISSDRVYVFTPEGHVVDLPNGATPVDFAYRIHTEIGHACRGAKIAGRIVPLTYKLKTGEQVEILTANRAGPSRDWLNPDAGYVRTSRARAKIIHWFKELAKDDNVSDGRSLVLAEMRKLSIKDVDFDEVARQVNCIEADDMFAAVGAGDLRLSRVMNAVQAMTEPQEFQLSLQLGQDHYKLPSEAGLEIAGVGNLMTHLAACCKPVPGDPVVGYITLGRGVSVHREDCANALQLREQEGQRMIQVDWGQQQRQTYPVDIAIRAYDRAGLLRDITQVLANEHVNVTAVNTLSDRKENVANMKITVEVSRLDALGRLLAKINQLPNVLEAMRHRD